MLNLKWWRIVGVGTICLGFSAAYISWLRDVRRIPGELVAATPTQTWRSPLATAAPQDRTVRFHLANRGDLPVQIRNIESSCGCVQVHVEPRFVPAHGQAIVTVQPNPIRAGEKRVAITIVTDSLVQPSVRLEVAVTGSSLPPYFLKFEGDLGELRFDETNPAGAARELRVETEELDGSPIQNFTIRCSLPFLELTQHGMTESPHVGGDRYVSRNYRFALRLK